jgi:hypothetical protein
MAVGRSVLFRTYILVSFGSASSLFGHRLQAHFQFVDLANAANEHLKEHAEEEREATKVGVELCLEKAPRNRKS